MTDTTRSIHDNGAAKPQDLTGNRGASKPQNLTGQAKDFARDVKGKAGELAGDAAQIGKDQAAKLGETAKELASGAAGQLQDTVRSQRTAGADYIGSVAAATERAAAEFDQAMPQAAHYIRQASEQIQSMADTVRERDVRELVSEVETFARRQPTLFFGGAVILGFAALRFLKSSSPGTEANAYEQRRVM
jgi:uncharacterized protein YukE